jgi:hypothetical protein
MNFSGKGVFIRVDKAAWAWSSSITYTTWQVKKGVAIPPIPLSAFMKQSFAAKITSNSSFYKRDGPFWIFFPLSCSILRRHYALLPKSPHGLWPQIPIACWLIRTLFNNVVASRATYYNSVKYNKIIGVISG